MATTNVLTDYQKYLIDNKKDIIINEILIINDNKNEIREEVMKRIEFRLREEIRILEEFPEI
jgi:hypothetical protein